MAQDCRPAQLNVSMVQVRQKLFAAVPDLISQTRVLAVPLWLRVATNSALVSFAEGPKACKQLGQVGQLYNNSHMNEPKSIALSMLHWYYRHADQGISGVVPTPVEKIQQIGRHIQHANTRAACPRQKWGICLYNADKIQGVHRRVQGQHANQQINLN